MAVTVEQLVGMSQSERDDLFRASPAGEIPDGDSDGTVLLSASTRVLPPKLLDRIGATFARWLAWRGKVFRAREGDLLNKVTFLDVKAIKAKVYKGPSWLDGKEAVVLDYSKTSFLAQKIRDEIREVAPGIYLGLVWWGESRLIEFALEFPHPNGDAGRPVA
jgi:hypothetical protein